LIEKATKHKNTTFSPSVRNNIISIKKLFTKRYDENTGKPADLIVPNSSFKVFLNKKKEISYWVVLA